MKHPVHRYILFELLNPARGEKNEYSVVLSTIVYQELKSADVYGTLLLYEKVTRICVNKIF